MKKILLSAMVLATMGTFAQVKVGTNPTVLATDANFQVEGTTTAEQFVVLKNGNVGIGTTTPSTKLSVLRGANGEVGPVITASAPVFSLVREGTGGTKWPLNATFDLGTYATGVNSQSQLDIKLANGGVATPDVTVMSLQGNGNVGIGTTTPGAKLNVVGSAIITTGNDNTSRGGLHLQSGNTINQVIPPLSNLTFSNDDYSLVMSNKDNGTIGSVFGFSQGTNGTFDTFWQARSLVDSNPYNILLQPLGGTVGIGTTDPTMGGTIFPKLAIDINNPVDATAFTILSANSRRFALNANANGSFSMFDGVNNNWNLGITQNNGNVGIGTTTPKSKLDVAGQGGLVAALGNIGGASNATLLPFTNTQQLILGWNRSGSIGEINFFNSNADHLPGGFNWGNLNQDGSTTTMAWLNNSGLAINNIQAGAATDAVVVADANGLLKKVSASTIGNDGDAWGVTGEDTTSSIGRTGNVGIGTATPISKLHITSTSNINSGLILQGGDFDAGYGAMWVQGSGFQQNLFISGKKGSTGGNTTNDLTQNVVGSNILLNHDGGNVGIGTTTPSTPLHVNAATTLGTTAGSETSVARFSQFLGNNSFLNISTRRHIDGGDWNGTNIRIQKTIDVSPMGFIDYGIDGVGSSFGLGFGSGNTTQMVLNGGNVGIGTTSPTHKLTIAGTSGVLGVDNQAIFQAKNAAGVYESFLVPRWADDVMYLDYGANGFNIRNNSGLPTMFMTNSGNVGIGTTTPLLNLDINSNFANTNSGFGIRSTAGAWDHFYLRHNGSTAEFLAGGAETGLSFKVGTGASGSYGDASQNYVTAMTILPSGNLGIGTTTPGAKLEVNGFIKVGSSDTATPSAGMIKFNAATSKFQGFDGTAWVDLH